MVQTFNLSNQEVEAGRSLQVKDVLVYIVTPMPAGSYIVRLSYLPHFPKNSKIKARVAHLYYFPLSLSRGWFSSFPSLSAILDSSKSIPQDSEGKEGGKMAKKMPIRGFYPFIKIKFEQ